MEWLIFGFIIGISAFIVSLWDKRKKRKGKAFSVKVSGPAAGNTEGVPTDTNYSDNYWIPVEWNQRKVEAHLKVKYKKVNNEIHERLFDVSSFSRGDEGYHVHGYCHRRKKNITLSSLGMVDVIDVDTGRRVENVIEFLEEKYRATPAFIEDSLFDEYDWALDVLIYLAATSGSVVKKERDVIAAFIKSIPKFSSLDDAWIDESLKKLYRPGKVAIRNRVKEAIGSGKDFSLISDAVARLEAMQKQENKEFWTFKRYLETKAAEQVEDGG
jgi:hypothetical protein